MNEQMPPPMALYSIGTSYYVSQALYVAAKLGVPDQLADGPRTAEALAEATSTHAPSLRRVLRLLVTADVFSEDAEGRFGLTPFSALMKSGPGSFRSAILLFAGPSQWASWGDLINTVRTGQPALERVFGQGPFEYFDAHPEEARIFDEAMSSFTAQTAIAVAEAYAFSSVRSIVDVGGGNGALIGGLLSARPHLRGAVFDLPRLAEAAKKHLGGRAEFIGGDFFESVPTGYDVYLLKHVIHDWNDERATKILANVRRAMPDGAKLLLVEGVYPDRVDPSARGAAANDVNMLVATGGRQRSKRELEELYRAAGFRLSRIVPTAAMSCIIEGAPA